MRCGVCFWRSRLTCSVAIEQRLADYAHLLALCLAPHDHLSLEGLSEMAHAEKIAAVQKEALSQVLPTERDTLAGAIKTLTILARHHSPAQTSGRRSGACMHP